MIPEKLLKLRRLVIFDEHGSDVLASFHAVLSHFEYPPVFVDVLQKMPSSVG